MKFWVIIPNTNLYTIIWFQVFWSNSNFPVIKISSTSFKASKHFKFIYSIKFLRVNELIYFKIISDIISNRSIWPIDGTLIVITAWILGGSNIGPHSNYDSDSEWIWDGTLLLRYFRLIQSESAMGPLLPWQYLQLWISCKYCYWSRVGGISDSLWISQKYFLSGVPSQIHSE